MKSYDGGGDGEEQQIVENARVQRVCKSSNEGGFQVFIDT